MARKGLPFFTSSTSVLAKHDAQAYRFLDTMQATGVTRLKGALQDADTLGPQVSSRNRIYKGSCETVRGMLYFSDVICNGQLSLPYLCNSADMNGRCGCQVWARLHSGLWWPGEMLDPFHLPPTRSLPPGAAAGKHPVTGQ